MHTMVHLWGGGGVLIFYIILDDVKILSNLRPLHMCTGPALFGAQHTFCLVILVQKVCIIYAQPPGGGGAIRVKSKGPDPIQLF